MAQYLASGILIGGRVVPDESETMVRIRGSLLPPERTARCERRSPMEQNPVGIGGLAEKTLWSQRRNIRGNFAG
jgi:hypothetical protein